MVLAGGTPAFSGGRLAGGRYEVAEIIGTGGMGVVRAGRDVRLGRDVAIKLLRPDVAGQPAVRQRFEDEARLAARLLHPHVVAVFDCGEEHGIPYLVMERLSGRTLADDIAIGPLDCEVVRTIGVQILDALDAAHTANLVHRDVKPGNVLAATPGFWKVGDFGIAKSMEASDPSLTVFGMIIGTPAYLAPERLAGGPATVASDLYATGAVLYEALTGRRPVSEGVPLSVLLTATPAPVNDLRADVPPSLARVVMRAMAHDPTDRYATAAEMATALRQRTFAPGEADTVVVRNAEPAMATQLLTQPVLATTPTRQAARSLAFAQPRRRLTALAVATLALIVVVIVAVSASRHHGSTTQPPSATTLPAPAVTPRTVPAALDAALRRLESEVRP